MRIGFFTDSYHPYTSGVVRSLEIFQEELRCRGHQVYIFAPNYPDCPPEEDVFRFFSIPAVTQKNFTLAVPLSPTLSRRVKSLELDIVHVHSPFLLGSVGARWARRLGLPLVFTYHTRYEEYVHYFPFFPQVSRPVVRYYVRDFSNRCNLVVAPSGSMAEKLQGDGVRSPVTVVPTGIRYARLQGGEPGWLRHRYGIPEGVPVLLYVGRLAREKNLEFLLEAFQQILRQEPECRLVMVGSGPAREELVRRAARLGVAGRLVFTGVLPPPEVANCYQGADLFLFASLTETQGLVLVEAMAAGLPVVAVQAGGVTDVLQDGRQGFISQEKVQDLAAKALLLLRDPELRRQMGARARERAQEFTAERCTDRLLAAYNLVLTQETRFSRAG
ncbi:MAG: glycosyltransferase family 4 protein [Clostridia bacterium]|nr:MAG: glycosyltransferase family 4 protein [Clostridia bacterium]